MNVINATILRNNLSDSLKEVSKGRDYLLVSKRGKITSALVAIDLFEDLLNLSNSKLKESVKQARAEYKKGLLFSHEDVFGSL